MSLISRFSYSIIFISLFAAYGCNKDGGCGYFGTAEDLSLSYHSYECDGDGVRNGVARVEYLLDGDLDLSYEWDVEGVTSIDEFINLKGSGDMSGFVRVTNNRDGCFIYKNVDMLFDMPHGTIGNKVWIDSETQGIQGRYDDADKPAPGVTVELLDTNLETIDMQVTDAQGTYLFKHLPDGEYIVRFRKPTGYSFCPPNLDDDKSDSDVDDEGYTDIITLSECEVNITIDAGLVR